MNPAVVIVSYEVREELSRCLASLARAGFAEGTADGRNHVVVVDNGSTDGTVALVRARHPWVDLVARSDNRGFSASVNEGVRRTTTTSVLLLNPDTEVPPDTADHLRAAFAHRPDAGVVGFRHIDASGAFQLSLGPWPSFAGELARRFVQRRLDAGDRRMRAVCDWVLRRPRPVAWVSGSALLARRSVFDAVGGFDEGYFLYFEDLDFCLRVWEAGHSVHYEPALTIRHARGRSASRDPERAAAAYRASQLRFWATHNGPVSARLVQAYLRVTGKV